MATVAILQQAPYGPSVSLPAPYPEDSALPFSLRPQPETSLDEITAEIEAVSKSGRIEELLNQHGAIYFQDLKLKDAQEFSKFTHAFGFVPHEDIGNPVRRTILAPNVATANEGPNTMPVYPHNEFGLSPHYPAYVFFYCVSPPETGGWLFSPPQPWACCVHMLTWRPCVSGGETPINNSVILLEQLKAKHPEFIEELEKRVRAGVLFAGNKLSH